MKEAIIPVITILAFAVTARCSDMGKDGFNFYKDHLRGRSDEGLPEDVVGGDRLYFYRTPLQIYPGLLPPLDQEYRKRTGNIFKNHMLSKEAWIDPNRPAKRSSKTALALMLEGKHPYQPLGCIRGLARGGQRVLVLLMSIGGDDQFSGGPLTCWSAVLHKKGKAIIARMESRHHGARTFEEAINTFSNIGVVDHTAASTQGDNEEYFVVM